MKLREIISVILLAVGFILAVGAVGTLEFLGDAIEPHEFRWEIIKCIIAAVLMVISPFVAMSKQTGQRTTTVFCDQNYCRYYCNGECANDCIYLDFNCQDYEDITQSPEYQTPYYIACRKDGKTYRELKHGKRIEINGEEFFAESNTAYPQSRVSLTHGRTGYLMPYRTIADIYEFWDIIKNRLDELPDVITLPLKEGE